ncbi:MAG: helix-turn-helix transcriptional regulator [Spirochaetes bacterium]|nr:helix-turn-helix transcriptional regulator [Spirochaetota bacterium]
MVFHTERGVEFLSANDALIAMPGERHGNGYCTHARTVACMLMLGFEKDGSLTGLEPESARILGRGIRTMKRRRFYAGPRVLECFNRIRRIDRGDPYAVLRYRMCITDMLIALFDAEASPQQRPLSREIRLSSSYIEKHACERFDVDALSARTNLTPSGFRHRFLRETGMAPKEYLMRERVRIAAERIRRGGSDLTSVAYASGFSSSQYFTRIFKRYTGQSPRDYQSSPGTFA